MRTVSPDFRRSTKIALSSILALIAILSFIALHPKSNNIYVFYVGVFLIGSILILLFFHIVFPNLSWFVRNISVVENCRKLNIQNVTLNGSIESAFLKERIDEAKSIKIMFVSGSTFLHIFNNNLRNLLIRGGRIKLLLANPDSDFVKEIEAIEKRSVVGSLSSEINGSIKRFNILIDQAKNRASDDVAKSMVAEYAFYNTHLRTSLVIIDDIYCYAIFNTPPKTTQESVGLYFINILNDNPASHFVEHFNEVYNSVKGT